jgi:hypothetical protein
MRLAPTADTVLAPKVVRQIDRFVPGPVRLLTKLLHSLTIGTWKLPAYE